jgi:hypothetical protein
MSLKEMQLFSFKIKFLPVYINMKSTKNIDEIAACYIYEILLLQL